MRPYPTPTRREFNPRCTTTLGWVGSGYLTLRTYPKLRKHTPTSGLRFYTFCKWSSSLISGRREFGFGFEVAARLPLQVRGPWLSRISNRKKVVARKSKIFRRVRYQTLSAYIFANFEAKPVRPVPTLVRPVVEKSLVPTLSWAICLFKNTNPSEKWRWGAQYFIYDISKVV